MLEHNVIFLFCLVVIFFLFRKIKSAYLKSWFTVISALVVVMVLKFQISWFMLVPYIVLLAWWNAGPAKEEAEIRQIIQEAESAKRKQEIHNEARHRAYEANRRREAEEQARQRIKEQTRQRAEEQQKREAEQTHVRFQKHFAVFELTPSASFEEVKEKYRLMLKFFHPDRQAGADKTAQDYATMKTKEINAAFEFLKANYFQKK